MAKTDKIPVAVDPEFHQRLNQKAKATAVSLSEIARRAWEVWLETGELPKLPEKKGGKRKTK